MKKSAVIIIVVIVVVALGAGAWWLMMNKATAPADSASTPDTSVAPDTSSTDTTATPDTSAEVLSGTVNMDMKSEAFTKASIKVKKGTKVVWTNQDSIRHNVVADSSNSNNVPTDNDLLDKGQSYSFTFNSVGTVKYHCTPHPFMTGTIEVVE